MNFSACFRAFANVFCASHVPAPKFFGISGCAGKTTAFYVSVRRYIIDILLLSYIISYHTMSNIEYKYIKCCSRGLSDPLDLRREKRHKRHPTPHIFHLGVVSWSTESCLLPILPPKNHSAQLLHDFEGFERLWHVLTKRASRKVESLWKCFNRCASMIVLPI